MKNPISILLVEDDKDDQEFFFEALSGLQNVTECKIANNGREAIQMLENAAILPEFIFMDIHMPQMNGIECFSEIIRNPKTKHIPVTFLSSDLGKENIVLNLGAMGFIKKAPDGEALRKSA